MQKRMMCGSLMCGRGAVTSQMSLLLQLRGQSFMHRLLLKQLHIG